MGGGILASRAASESTCLRILHLTDIELSLDSRSLHFPIELEDDWFRPDCACSSPAHPCKPSWLVRR